MTYLPGNVRVEKEIAAQSGRFQSGKHAEDQFDPVTGRRLATTVIHERVFHYEQPSGVDVASESRVIGTLHQDAEIVEVAITPEVKPSHAAGGTDKTYTVNVLLGNATTAFTSILSGGTAIVIDSTDVNRTTQFIVPTTTAGERGDQIKVTVTASGSTNTQGQGLSVAVKVREHPDA